MADSFGAAFGRLVKERRGNRRMKQGTLGSLVFADRANTSPEVCKQDVSKLERGQIANPTARVIAAYCAVLEISPAEVEAIHRQIAEPDPEPVEALMTRAAGLAALHLSLADRAAIEEALRRAESELHTTRTMLAVFLKTILTKDIPADQFAAALFELAVNWRFAGEQINALDASRNLTPELDKLRQKAKDAYAAEQAETVWSLLTEVEVAEQRAYDKLANYAQDVAREMDQRREGLRATKSSKLALAKASYQPERTAALLVESLLLDAPPEPFKALRALRREWYERGRDRGLAFDATVAVHLAEHTLLFAANPEERGTAFNSIGVSLWTLGQREQSTVRLKAAVLVYEAALIERTKISLPLEWAKTQNNLGNTLHALGDREEGTSYLEAAVTAFSAALSERTREHDPIGWARVQNNLGRTLRNLGVREGNPVRLAAAVLAYNNALSERSRSRAPQSWAMTQNNLGNALRDLGEFETNAFRVELAISAYKAALEVRTQAEMPLAWAQTKNNLGKALLIIDRCEARTARLVEAQTVLSEALIERSRDRVPLDWADTQINLAAVEIAYFDKTADPAHLISARAYAMAARAVFVAAEAGHYVGITDNILAKIANREAQ